VSKAKQVYCKQHGKFDACADSVAKAYKAKPKPGDPGFMGHAIKNAHKRHRAALQRSKTENLGDNGIIHAVGKAAKFPQGGDDGIRHLTGTSHITTSVEGRGTGKLVACEVGNRQFDGTPMMGHAKGHAAILPQDKQGESSPATAAVGGTSLREQVPGKSVSKAHEADPFEVSKAGLPKTKKQAQNLGMKIRGVEGSVVGGAVGSMAGKKGAAVGAGLGALAGTASGHSYGTHYAERNHLAKRDSSRDASPKKGQHPPEVHAYIEEKKKDLSKSLTGHDGFSEDVEKAFDPAAALGGVKTAMSGVKAGIGGVDHAPGVMSKPFGGGVKLGGALRPMANTFKKPAVQLGGAAATGGFLGAKAKNGL
jgi:hypothetical protein